MKTLALIVALDEANLIGRNGDLPWRLPNDLKHFKALTLDKTVLMGRKTWDSLGRPLPQRKNWVVTRDAGFRAEGARIFATLDDALAAHEEGELMIIGGGEIYRQTLPLADRLYLTRVQAAVEGDAWFPHFDAGDFVETENQAHPADERHAYPYRFLTLDRRR